MKYVFRTITVLVLVCALMGVVHSQNGIEPPPIGLNAVLARMQTYVAAYEGLLGMLIGEEEYVQNATWRGGGRPLTVVGRERRRLSSDFLLLSVGTRWFAVRSVLRVDGVPVEARENFASDVAESPARLIPNWPDNTQYNIGDFQRSINVPTFALTFLRPENFHRFSFEKGLERKIENVNTWELRFSEVVRPTLVRGSDGKNLYARGKLWVGPETGEILKTEIVFEGESSGTDYQATVLVSYKDSPEMEMLVPSIMEERYETEYHSINARADYSNFKRFTVEIDTEINLDLGQQ